MIALLAVVCIVPVASARPFVVVGGYYGPGYYYGPAWYGPGWGMPYGYYRGPVTGGVKFDTKMKDASVFVDGGYAGTVGKLKTFQLRPRARTTSNCAIMTAIRIIRSALK